LYAIQQLNYHPNLIARSLKTRKTFTISIIITDILNSTLASIERSIEEFLVEKNYSLVISNSDESPERERMWLERLRERRFDGLILLPTGGNLPLMRSLFEDSEQHLVLIDRQIEGLNADTVLFDNEGGAYLAVSHLIERGHTRIGMLNLPNSLTPGHGRQRGYELAMREHGLPIHPDLVRQGSFKAQEGTRLVCELLDQALAPTALFVSSNRLAQSVLEEVKRRRLHIPDDLALCVFDDVPYFSFITPSITAVSIDMNDFGQKTVQFLLERIDGDYCGEPRVAKIPCTLNVRESTTG
jgi:LacI family kdg operon repressor